MAKVKITTIGNSAGIILSRETMAKLNVEKGDTLYLVDTDYGIELTPYDPEVEKDMESVQRVMRRNREALRRLAK